MYKILCKRLSPNENIVESHRGATFFWLTLYICSHKSGRHWKQTSFKFQLNTDRDDDNITSSGRLFHVLADATWNAWSLIVQRDKPVGDWISAPSQNFDDPQTMTDSMTQWLLTMTDLVTHKHIGDFVQILGSKFWSLGGLNQKLKNNVL